MEEIERSVRIKKVFQNKSNGQLLIYLPKKKLKTIPTQGKFVWFERRK